MDVRKGQLAVIREQTHRKCDRVAPVRPTIYSYDHVLKHRRLLARRLVR